MLNWVPLIVFIRKYNYLGTLLVFLFLTLKWPSLSKFEPWSWQALNVIMKLIRNYLADQNQKKIHKFWFSELSRHLLLMAPRWAYDVGGCFSWLYLFLHFCYVKNSYFSKFISSNDLLNSLVILLQFVYWFIIFFSLFAPQIIKTTRRNIIRSMH